MENQQLPDLYLLKVTKRELEMILCGLSIVVCGQLDLSKNLVGSRANATANYYVDIGENYENLSAKLRSQASLDTRDLLHLAE